MGKRHAAKPGKTVAEEPPRRLVPGRIVAVAAAGLAVGAAIAFASSPTDVAQRARALLSQSKPEAALRLVQAAMREEEGSTSSARRAELLVLKGSSLAKMDPSLCKGSPCPQHAAAAFGDALRLAPGHRAARKGLLLVTADLPTSSTEPARVAALFDDFAPSFEYELQVRLKYDVPSQLPALVGSRPINFLLDAGCGTGLVAQAFVDAGRTPAIVGIDLSPEMARHARQRGTYDAVSVCDVRNVAACLATIDRGGGDAPQLPDLVTFADVLVYLDDPTPALRNAARTLGAGGLLIATIERPSADDEAVLDESKPAWRFLFGASGRYAHNARWLVETLTQQADSLLALKRTVMLEEGGESPPLRYESGKQVRGTIFVFERLTQ